MADPWKRMRNGKVRWYAAYYDPDGKRKMRVFDKREDARQFLTKIAHSKDTGSYSDPDLGKIKMSAFADQWLEAQSHLKIGTRTKYAGIVERHIKPRFGGTPLTKITYEDVSAWVSGLTSARGGKMSPGAVRYTHRVLHLILDHAVKGGRISANPAKGVRLPKIPRGDKRFLTRDQVWELADAAAAYPLPEVGEQYRVMILLLSLTGLRWGEAAGLKVKRLNLMRRRLTVAETLVDVGGHLHTSRPKNHQAREVPVPPFLCDMLAGVVAGKEQDDLVFTSWRGRPLRNGDWRRDVFNKAAADAGLDGITPHELRHTAASLAVSSGANVKAVQRMLGHASAAMTLDVYAGLFNDDLEALAERMDAHGCPPVARQPDAEVINFSRGR
jgi:integrase